MSTVASLRKARNYARAGPTAPLASASGASISEHEISEEAAVEPVADERNRSRIAYRSAPRAAASRC